MNMAIARGFNNRLLRLGPVAWTLPESANCDR